MTFNARAHFVRAGAVVAAAILAAGVAAPLHAQQQQTSSNASERRICVRMELTGTRVVRQVCRTQAEWDRAGGIPTD